MRVCSYHFAEINQYIFMQRLTFNRPENDANFMRLAVLLQLLLNTNRKLWSLCLLSHRSLTDKKLAQVS